MSNLTLEINDLTPRFLAFYERALAEDADPERRWELWREFYNVAAIPPTPEGQLRARRLLDGAWERYPSVLQRIQAGAAGLEPNPRAVVDAVAELLDFREPATVQLTVFVGGLEDNAYAYRAGATPVVNIPVEQAPACRALVLPHEFTHAVHTLLADLSGGWERPIAQVVMEEGLATRVTAALVPGRPDAGYVAYLADDHGTSDRFEQCVAREPALLAGLRPFLSDSRSDTVARFTFGGGTTGLERETYYAGWVLVGQLLAQGRTLAELAATPVDALAPLIERTIDTRLAAHFDP
jgi:hypothetical protein